MKQDIKAKLGGKKKQKVEPELLLQDNHGTEMIKGPKGLWDAKLWCDVKCPENIWMKETHEKHENEKHENEKR